MVTIPTSQPQSTPGGGGLPGPRLPGGVSADVFGASYGRGLNKIVKDDTDKQARERERQDGIVAERAIIEATKVQNGILGELDGLYGPAFFEKAVTASERMLEAADGVGGGLSPRQQDRLGLRMEALKADFSSRLNRMESGRWQLYDRELFADGVQTIADSAAGNANTPGSFALKDDGSLLSPGVDTALKRIDTAMAAFGEGQTTEWQREQREKAQGAVHASVLGVLLQNGQLDEADAYLKKYEKTVPKSTSSSVTSSIGHGRDAREVYGTAADAYKQFPVLRGDDADSLKALAAETGATYTGSAAVSKARGHALIDEKIPPGENRAKAHKQLNDLYTQSEVVFSEFQAEAVERLTAVRSQSGSMEAVEQDPAFWNVLEARHRDGMYEASKPGEWTGARREVAEERLAAWTDDIHGLNGERAQIAAMRTPPGSIGLPQDLYDEAVKLQDAAVKRTTGNMTVSGEQAGILKEYIDAKYHGDKDAELKLRVHMRSWVRQAAETSGGRVDDGAFEKEILRVTDPENKAFGEPIIGLEPSDFKMSQVEPEELENILQMLDEAGQLPRSYAEIRQGMRSQGFSKRTLRDMLTSDEEAMVLSAFAEDVLAGRSRHATAGYDPYLGIAPEGFDLPPDAAASLRGLNTELGITFGTSDPRRKLRLPGNNSVR